MPPFISRPAARPQVQRPVPSPTENGKAPSTSSEIARGLRIGKMQGGQGGEGGHGEDTTIGETHKPGIGGRGGHGGEAVINHQDDNSRMMVDEFYGGTGGKGGDGTTAGEGGDGGKAIVKGDEETLLSKTRLPGPNMTIQKFGAKFFLSEIVVQKLIDCGYDTAGSLRFATAKELKEGDFKAGHINQVRHALDLWSPKT